MEITFTTTHAITLKVQAGSASRFVSLLQSGIRLPAIRGTSIGAFLGSLPGFSPAYINEAVQTIFYNGTATDDMETVIEGENPVLAISAAMPGLAGAIFRRNSLHAALRTVKQTGNQPHTQGTVILTLKLFNAIARDRGVELLHRGVTITTDALVRFLDSHHEVHNTILTVDRDGNTMSLTKFTAELHPLALIHLRIIT